MTMTNQLFQAIYYGTDLEFMYDGSYYFINSGKHRDGSIEKHKIIVYKSKGSFYEDENDDECVEIYSAIDVSADVNTGNLFETKLFDGKTFYEIADNITNINY